LKNETKGNQMKKYASVSYDWREDGFEELEQALAKFGLSIVEDRMTDGSDQISYFIVEGIPSKEEVEDMVKEVYGDLIDEDEDDD